MFVNLSVYKYIHTNVYIYNYMYIYIHTYTHIKTLLYMYSSMSVWDTVTCHREAQLVKHQGAVCALEVAGM